MEYRMLHALSQKIVLLVSLLTVIITAQTQDSLYIAQHYNKHEYRIAMRDGAKLFTAVYTPKDTTQQYPILFARTPYRCAPYGEDKLPYSLGPSENYMKEGYIFVYQDVRGRFMSEGNFVDMTPYIPEKADNTAVDESSDAYDSIDWLVKNIAHNNGKVGVWGISYPGFYAAMSAIDAHPNLVAVSPQAPIANWFMADDMHHNGALSLLMNFNFFTFFGVARPQLTTEWPAPSLNPVPDAYTFFLGIKTLADVNKDYYHGNIAFWNDVIRHPNYDDFWKARNTLPHFKNIKPAVLVVGGWYDSEDLYGTLHTFQAIELSKNHSFNSLVMGPWFHHGWPAGPGNSFGDIQYGTNTGEYYRDSVEFPFFNYYLKGKGTVQIPKALLFETGSNKWKSYDAYPPKDLKNVNFYLQPGSKLSTSEPAGTKSSFDEYVSDPNKPVPYTSKIQDARRFYYQFYMNEDQRFVAGRPDVMSYVTEPLTEDVTILGDISADLFVATSGTDADWVVKVIDVFPDSAKNPYPNPNGIKMGGYQMLVRGEIMRGKYRDGYENPKPFEPNKPAEVKVTLQDVSHSFLKGHKIMVQIQSSWFPFYDRNPQTFCDIYNAKESDFVKATQKIYFSKEYPSHVKLKLVK
jgi:putative CocE/NonD family hydrolase